MLFKYLQFLFVLLKNVSYFFFKIYFWLPLGLGCAWAPLVVWKVGLVSAMVLRASHCGDSLLQSLGSLCSGLWLRLSSLAA